MSRDESRFERSIWRVVNLRGQFDFSTPFRLQTASGDAATGTAYFISQRVLVTCFHVVASAQQIFVQSEPEVNYIAKVLYACPTVDIAFLYLINERVKGEPLKIAAEDKIKPGDYVIGRGYAVGATSLHTNRGVVSRYQDHLLVVDTPQNHGNSGGPQFDEHDVVVATCRAGMVEANNISYGVPSLYTRLGASEVLTALTGKMFRLEHDWSKFDPKFFDQEAAKWWKTRPKGADGNPKDPAPIFVIRPAEDFRVQRGNEMLLASRGLALPGKQQPEGVMIMQVMAGGPSQKAGLKHKDLLLTVNGHQVSGSGMVLNYPKEGQMTKMKTFFMNSRPGDSIELGVMPRGQNKVRKIQIKATSARDRAVAYKFPEMEKIDYEVFAGLVFLNLSHNIDEFSEDPRWYKSIELNAAFRFENANEPKLVVVNVLPESFFACKHTVYPGNLVVEVNGMAVRDLDSLRVALKTVIENHKQEFIIFDLDNGGEAVIHKVIVAKQEPLLMANNRYAESDLTKLLNANIEGMHFESSDDCAYYSSP